jgi:hypothetical protein
VSPEECKLERNLFLCASWSECVEVRDLCDGVEHCHDGSDEGPACNASKWCISRVYDQLLSDYVPNAIVNFAQVLRSVVLQDAVTAVWHLPKVLCASVKLVMTLLTIKLVLVRIHI